MVASESPSCINIELISAISSADLPSAMQQAIAEMETVSSQEFMESPLDSICSRILDKTKKGGRSGGHRDRISWLLLIMEYKKEIIKRINDLSGSRSPYEVFCDWVKCMGLSIQNGCTFFHNSIWKAREEEYLKTIQPYGELGKVFSEMAGLLVLAMEQGPSDYLGEIYMESGLGNKNTGQFFTPFHLSCVCAQLSLAEYDGSRKIPINEPSCGGGGMIIAAAKVLQDRGINYQKCMDVVAQDLDWKAVYMCYVQLSIMGIKAVVVQGNTLSDPYTGHNYPPEHVFRTPAKMGVLI